MSAIVADSVTKRYRQYEDQGLLIKRLLQPHRSRTMTEVKALDDVSFEVSTGETLGIIGRNGSGKTTLLRLLSGVSAPTSGRVSVRGAIAPLISIGVGFNPELTGRENVHVNGRLLGLTEEQVRDRFDEIVDFSEIREFIDVPVKFYSSGMFLRLAFSVAVHTDPEVVVVDEILAVGDLGFRAKSDAKLTEIRDGGATIVVVTHNLQMLQRLADRTLVLERGRLLHDGPTADALTLYHELVQEHGSLVPTPGLAPDTHGGVRARVSAELLDDVGQRVTHARAGEPLHVQVQATFDGPVSNPSIAIAVERPGSGILYAAASDPRHDAGQHDADRPLEARVTLQQMPLLAGPGMIRVVCRVDGQTHPVGAAPPLTFNIASDAPGGGPVDLDAAFEIMGKPVPTYRPRMSNLSRE